MDRIVKEGIAYNMFHTTAMCSPTRASLLTGRNHHRFGNGQIAEFANDWDGYSGRIPRSSALAPVVLKDYGYATAAWGKWHNTPADETTPAGPFENWPTGLGFEYFYGFWPARRRNTSRICPQHDLCPAAEDSGRRLPPQRRPGGRRDRLAAQTQGLPALQAIFHVLGEWRDPRSPSCREGMGGQVQGQVRRRLGCLSRARFRARQSEGLDTGRRATHPPA